jgi:uncharacterized membrane protein YgaE (UPF0421/DUF939 family)
MKVYNNLIELENLVKELVKIIKETREENMAFKKEILRVKRENERYESGIYRAVKMIDELVKELEEMKE